MTVNCLCHLSLMNVQLYKYHHYTVVGIIKVYLNLKITDVENKLFTLT